jgi:3-oxoacyl-[acyl-carrier protein] reductase
LPIDHRPAEPCLPERVVARWRAAAPLGRIGQAVDAANAILYLAADEAAYVTGVSISVDGGKALEPGTVAVYA